MLYNSVPFLDTLGIDTEWKIINGHTSYYESTKLLHNLLQGMKGSFTPEMKHAYLEQMKVCVQNSIINRPYDVINVNDPQPMLLCRHLKNGEHWIWRCHRTISQGPEWPPGASQ